jgi:hypothetical protein
LSIVPLVWLLFGVGVGIVGFIGLVRGRLAQYLEVLAAAYLVIAVAMTGVVVRSAQAPRGHGRLFIVVDDLNVPGDSVEVPRSKPGRTLPLLATIRGSASTTSLNTTQKTPAGG